MLSLRGVAFPCLEGLSTANGHQLCPPPQFGAFPPCSNTLALLVSSYLCSFLLPSTPRPRSIFLCLFPGPSCYPCPLRLSNHDVSLLRSSPAFWLLVTVRICHTLDSRLNFQGGAGKGAVPTSAFPPWKQSPGLGLNCLLTNTCFRKSSKRTYCFRKRKC